MRRRFAAQLLEHLQTVLRSATNGLEARHVEALFDWAGGYGVTRRYDVQRLAEMLLESGLPLDATPTVAPFADVLGRRYPSGTALVDVLVVERLAGRHCDVPLGAPVPPSASSPEPGSDFDRDAARERRALQPVAPVIAAEAAPAAGGSEGGHLDGPGWFAATAPRP